MDNSKSEILIVGGGIGGLTLALSLHAEGIACSIFESVPDFKPLGVGINLLPHALRELSALGLENELRSFGIEAREFVYYNRHGQKIFVEPCGRYAGYDYPHFSIHRADLHQVLLEAVLDRLGPQAVYLDHPCLEVEQTKYSVRAHFENGVTREGSILISADGFHSAIRRQFYPDEPAPQFGGINMWRGVTRRRPFLSGASVTRIGTVAKGKMMIYPIRQFEDGTQLINWVAEQPREGFKQNDWGTHGHIEDFIGVYQDWTFDWLDVPELIKNANFILEYPMVDRDPVSRWSFERVALMGDAAHPMYPRGGNGGAQAILDASILAGLISSNENPKVALQTYEHQRLKDVNEIVLTNRTQPPDYIIEHVDLLTNGEPFKNIEDIISVSELAAISDRYKEVAKYSLGDVGGNLEV